MRCLSFNQLIINKKQKKRMKKLFFLFAVSAMFAACSSDDQTEIVNGGGTTTNPTEQTVSVATVDYENGVQIAIGALDSQDEAQTRATDGAVNFVINLDKVDNILRNFGEYKLKADDFAIRLDGVYDETVEPVNNKVNKYSVEMVEESLKVAVKHLENLDFSNVDDYTFEFYLWIENKKLDTENGTGGYVELFKWDDKCNWVGPSFWETGEQGLDISKALWEANGFDGANFFEDGGQHCGLLVRYNVYRGLQGRPTNEAGEYDKENGLGDTPYIKVSVHVEKKDQTTPNSIKNECTWVRLPYTPKAE